MELKLSGYAFLNEELLKEALTHPCVGRKNYQRLELLGDRVLNMVVMEMLFHYYPEENEGSLTRRLNFLVNAPTCASVARNISASSHINIGDSNSNPLLMQQGVLADVCEALIGALYIDGGLRAASKFIKENWGDLITKEAPKDSKMALQEWAQAKKLPHPVYDEVERSGPQHAPKFVMRVNVGSKYYSFGEGKNKKEAEQDAAKQLLKSI